MDKQREEFEKIVDKLYVGYADFVLDKEGNYRTGIIDDMWKVYKSRDEENDKLRKALKICMSALQRETSRMPNYDITESQMWEMFNEALKDGE